MTVSCVKILNFITILSLISVFELSAQFYVSDGTIMQVNEIITSQEQINIINENVFGDAAIVFNYTQNQFLSHHTVEHIKLPGLNLEHTSLSIESSFVIDKNISLNDATLILFSPIYLNGQLFVDENSSINGNAQIILMTSFKPVHLPISNSQVYDIQFSTSMTKAHCSEESVLISKLANIHYIEQLSNSDYSLTTSPPPKAVLSC